MRINKVAQLATGEYVDLEIFVLDAYHPSNPSVNKIKSKRSPFAAINLRQPRSGDRDELLSMRFQFFRHDDRCGGPGPWSNDFSTWDVVACNERLTLPHITLSFFDVDAGIGYGQNRPSEKLSVWSATRHYLSSPSELVVANDAADGSVTVFNGCEGRDGVACKAPNPTVPNAMTAAQKAAAVSFDFEQADHAIVRFVTTPSPYPTGRNFLFSGDSNVLGTCPFPPPPSPPLPPSPPSHPPAPPAPPSPPSPPS